MCPILTLTTCSIHKQTTEIRQEVVQQPRVTEEIQVRVECRCPIHATMEHQPLPSSDGKLLTYGTAGSHDHDTAGVGGCPDFRVSAFLLSCVTSCQQLCPPFRLLGGVPGVGYALHYLLRTTL